MTDKLKLILDLSNTNSSAIYAFSKEYAPNIQALIKKNDGRIDDAAFILEELIADLYLKIKEGFDFTKFKIDPFVMTLSILIYKKRRKNWSKDRSPLIIDQDFYETKRIKLSIDKYEKLEERCESILSSLGEPGRTIIKLTFNERDSDEEIVKHVHFDSVEQLSQRRIKLLDKCIEDLSL